MRALSSRPFCSCGSQRVSLGDLSAGWRYTTRYPTREAYIDAVRRAAHELVKQQFLLADDATALVAEAEKDGIRLAP